MIVPQKNFRRVSPLFTTLLIESHPRNCPIKPSDAGLRQHLGLGEAHVDAHSVIGGIDRRPVGQAAAGLAAVMDDRLVAPEISVGRRRALIAPAPPLAGERKGWGASGTSMRTAPQWQVRVGIVVIPGSRACDEMLIHLLNYWRVQWRGLEDGSRIGFAVRDDGEWFGAMMPPSAHPGESRGPYARAGARNQQALAGGQGGSRLSPG